MYRYLLIIGICLALTACTNDANKDLENTTTSTTEQRQENNNSDKVAGDSSNTNNKNNEGSKDNGTNPDTPTQNNDQKGNNETPTNNNSNQGNNSANNGENPVDSGDIPASNQNGGGSSSNSNGNKEDAPFDYLTIQETPKPAITKVEGLLLVNKSFYLEDNYVPENLTKPNIKFSFSTDDQARYKLTSEAAKAIELLFNEAKNNGIELAGVSLYRSYARQKSIYNYNVQNKGIEQTSMYSAKPGFSEHQTGLAIDVSAASSGYSLVDTFGDTEEGKWVNENCARFGFIIRFLKGKENITGYAYEPWHLRYVGVDAATYIMENGITLEEYYQLKDK